MNPPRPPTRDAPPRSVLRRWGPLAALGLAPKCLLCGTAYFTGGAALLGGPELCGGAEPWDFWSPLAAGSGAAWLVLLSACARQRLASSSRSHRLP
jgi:hypothetical protein